MNPAQQRKLTPEEHADYIQRVKYFNAEMTGLLAKYKLALIPTMQILDDSTKVEPQKEESAPPLASSKD